MIKNLNKDFVFRTEKGGNFARLEKTINKLESSKIRSEMRKDG